MRGLPGDDGVDGAVRQRDLLRRPDDRRHAGEPGGQLAEHLRGRVDGDDLVPGGDQHLGQQAGAGAEIEHAQRLRAEQERHGSGG